MSANVVAPPIKIDLSVRQRKKGFNKRHQFANPFGETTSFEMPEQCQKQHNHKRFNCVSMDLEDIKNFRSQLYRTLEKREQREFLDNFISIKPPKRRIGKLVIARVIQGFYSLKNKNDEVVPVCKAMFRATTGLGRAQIHTILQKLYKKTIFENGDSESNIKYTPKKSMRDATMNEKEELLRSMIIKKKERLLQLEKGTYERFSKATTNKANQKRSKSTKPCTKIESNPELEPEPDLFIVDDDYYEEVTTIEIKEKERVLLDLKSMEICRICLESNDELLPIFERVKTEEHSYAEILEYCLSVELPQGVDFPSKICKKCVQHLKAACSFRNEFSSSQEIIENCISDNQHFIESSNVFEEADLDESYPDLKERIQESVKEEDSDNSRLDAEEMEVTEQKENEILEYYEVEESDEEAKPSYSKTMMKKFDEFSDIRPAKCYLCLNSGLEEHLIDFDPENAEDHFKKNHLEVKLTKCNLCDFETEFKWYLNLHYEVHEQNFKFCENCGRSFESGKFLVHRRSCGRKYVKLPKIYNCKFCSKSYPRPYDLKVHERMHNNEKPYKCSLCELGFAKNIGLRRHMLKHGIGASVFCPNCGKGYIQQYELTRHQKYCFEKGAAIVE